MYPPRGRKKSAFVFKGSAVCAFCFCGVGFVAAHFDVIKAAAVAVFAVIYAVVYVASDVSVCIHNKKPPFCFDYIFCRKKDDYSEKTFYF